MFSIEATYYLFNALVIIVPMLCWIASRTGMKLFCRLGYLLLAFVAVIRYDIGVVAQDVFAHATDLVFNDHRIVERNGDEIHVVLLSLLFKGEVELGAVLFVV